MLTQSEDIDSTIVSAQQGDRDAFARLVESHYDVIFNFAFKYTGNREDAEDVTHESCIKLAKFLGQFRFDSAFSTWLYRLVINCARDMYKSRKLPDQAGEQVEEQHTETAGAESGVLLQQILKEVEGMGGGFRETVVLVVGEELTHSEAAVVLGVKESTVSWRMFEMRKRLKALLPSEAS
jgi:RNA polymerase sigma-70 factor, ECF subfamily